MNQLQAKKFPLYEKLQIHPFVETELPIKISNFEVYLTSNGLISIVVEWNSDSELVNFKYPVYDGHSFGCGETAVHFKFAKSIPWYSEIWYILGKEIYYKLGRLYSPFYAYLKFLVPYDYKYVRVLDIGIQDKEDKHSYLYCQNLGWGVIVYFAPKDWNSGKIEKILSIEKVED
jgi:hypothetical protein